MPVIRVETFIAAPPERCFDVARDTAIHTQSLAGSGERVVNGPADRLLGLGDSVTWEARHLGVRQRLTARITQFDRPRRFVDEMARGAFARFAHSHEFRAEAGGTRMIDSFDYTAPLGPLGRLADALFLERYMRRLLRERALHLKRVAEAGG